MCDATVSLIKMNKPLMAANKSRYLIDPDGMHPDHEKHILLFDLIYCCSTYGLFQGINYVTPKTGDRKLMADRRKKAKDLMEQYKKALAIYERK